MARNCITRSLCRCRCRSASATSFRAPMATSAAAPSPTDPRRATAPPISSRSISCWPCSRGHHLGARRSSPGSDSFSRPAELDPVDLKTLGQFNLLGDPSIHPAAIASATSVPKGVDTDQSNRHGAARTSRQAAGSGRISAGDQTDRVAQGHAKFASRRRFRRRLPISRAKQGSESGRTSRRLT